MLATLIHDLERYGWAPVPIKSIESEDAVENVFKTRRPCLGTVNPLAVALRHEHVQILVKQGRRDLMH